MTIEYIRYAIDEARTDAFQSAYAEAEAALTASPHCLGYELSRCVEDPTSHILRIEWDSLDGHLKGFRGSDEFRVFLRHVQPFIGDIQEMRHYDVTLVGS
jgi:quinol monooxygenase YgiN